MTQPNMLPPGYREHYIRNEAMLARHTYQLNAPHPAGLYLTLHHGRDNPDEEMDDWGYTGPIIGPLKWIHITYCTTVSMGFADGDGTDGPLDTNLLGIDNDLMMYEGKYYGDWELQLLDERS